MPRNGCSVAVVGGATDGDEDDDGVKLEPHRDAERETGVQGRS
jgi:hypothetical protein